MLRGLGGRGGEGGWCLLAEGGEEGGEKEGALGRHFGGGWFVVVVSPVVRGGGFFKPFGGCSREDRRSARCSLSGCVVGLRSLGWWNGRSRNATGSRSAKGLGVWLVISAFDRVGICHVCLAVARRKDAGDRAWRNKVLFQVVVPGPCSLCRLLDS